MRFLFAMLGARLHYLTPRTIEEAGMLEVFHTDLCAVKGSGRLASALAPRGLGPRGLRRLMGRIPRGIPAGKIVTHEDIGWRYALRRTRRMTTRQAADLHLWAGREFCRRVLAAGFGSSDTIYVFNTAALELSTAARKRGLRVVHEQTIPPKKIEVELLAEEHRRFPGVATAHQDDGAWTETIEREIEELRLADLIICGSEFTRQSVASFGVDPARVAPIPNASDFPPLLEDPRRDRPPGPMRVLFVGEVGLRKGAHYFIEALRGFGRGEVVGRLVGTISLSPAFRDAMPRNVELTGPIPRSEMRAQFDWADVFCLPSLCEGSPIAICEALARGLPVITTPHADSLIRDGHNGRVVPIRDSAAIAQAIRSLADPAERRELGMRSSREAPPPYSFEAYRANLLRSLTRLGGTPDESPWRGDAPRG